MPSPVINPGNTRDTEICMVLAWGMLKNQEKR